MKLDDNNYGTRDKRGNWKHNEPVSVNPPYVYPFKPLKLNDNKQNKYASNH